MNNFISIVIPVYNAQKYLNDCLDTLLDNNDHSKFEIILIDDGSIDDSLDICQEYASKNTNVRVIHKENSGVSSTRNQGILLAKGKWIWFVDCDDLVYDGVVDSLFLLLENQDPDVLMFTYQEFEKTLEHKSAKKIEASCISKEEAVGKILDYRYGCFPWNKVIRRSLLLDNNVKFPEDMKMCEDIEFSYRVFDVATKFVNVPFPLYGYRRDGNGASYATDPKKFKDAAVANYDLCNYIEQNYPKYSKSIIQDTIVAIVAYLHRFTKEDREYSKLSDFIYQHEDQGKNMEKRYRIETQLFIKNRVLFNLIGRMGYLKRRIIG